MNPEIREENPLDEKIYPPPTPDQPLLQVPYQADFQKVKVCLSILCILDADIDLAVDLASRIDLDRLKAVYECVVDESFTQEMNLRLKTLSQELNQESLKDCIAFHDNCLKVKSYDYKGSRIEKQLGEECLKNLQMLFGKGDSTHPD